MTELLTRAATVASTLDVEARTIQVVFASQAPVRRYSWDDGHYDEILLCGRENVDLSRADNMALLDSHGAYSLDDRLGSVVPGSVRFEKGQVLATIKLSRRAKAEELLQDLQDGHSLPISVGYRITQEERTEAERGGVATVRAVRWQPMEISVVPIPADANAKTRSKEPDMPETTTQPEGQQKRAARPDTVAERTRIKNLRDLARSASMADEELDEAIDAGTSVEAFRSRAFDVMIARQEASPTFPHAETRGMGGDHTSIRAAMADALMVRINSSHKPQDSAREFVGLSLPELARRSLEAAGVSTRSMAPGEVVSRALHTTSDYSEVISTVGQTVLGAAYTAVPSGVKALARQTTARDFKLKTTARLSGFSDLEKVNEHGEFKRGTFSEGSEGYRISTFGKTFGMTRQMLVNDELGAFADVSRELGLSAARLEAEILAGLVNTNPAMSDTKAVFHADHKNLASTGAPLSETTLSAARLTMGKQVGLAGELIDVVPAYLVVSLEQQTAAEKLLATIQAAKTEDVNVFSGRLQLVVDRRLGEKPWYLAADPSLVPSLEFAYLEGQEGPQFITKQGFDIDGVQIRVSVDFGAGWVDHRGWYKNAGQ